MHAQALLQLLVLLALANGAPVAAKMALRGFLAWPLDFGLKLPDDRPVFGTAKTWRGIAASLLVTCAAAPLVGLDWRLGLLVSGFAMIGDLTSSFLKRRMGLAPSSRATGLDQIPESLFPLLACRSALSLSAADIAVATALFFFGALILSRLASRLGLRERPY